MAFPFIFAAAATVFKGATSIYGNMKANEAEAEAARINNAFYLEQAEFARQSTKRAVDLYLDQVADFKGNQISSFARGGVAMAGSPLLALMDTSLKSMREEDAIKEDGRMKEREALLKAGASAQQAESLSSFSLNGLQSIGTAVSTGVSIFSLGK